MGSPSLRGPLAGRRPRETLWGIMTSDLCTAGRLDGDTLTRHRRHFRADENANANTAESEKLCGLSSLGAI